MWLLFGLLLKGKLIIKNYPKVLKMLNHIKSLSTQHDWWLLSLCWLSGEKHGEWLFVFKCKKQFGASGTLVPWILRVLQQLLELSWRDNIIQCCQHIVAFLYFYRHLVSYWHIDWITQDPVLSPVVLQQNKWGMKTANHVFKFELPAFCLTDMISSSRGCCLFI